MCLGIPGRVVRLLDGYGGQLALVDVEGAERKINIGLLDGVPLGPGDWILIHMGMAMEKVEQSQADDARAGLELLGRGTEEPWS
jgi:hydrogenase expression/formation protein HypC